MSIVADQVRRLDAQIDRISLVPLVAHGPDADQQVATAALSSPRVRELLRIVKSLSETSALGTSLEPEHIERLLLESGLGEPQPPPDELQLKSNHEIEIEWLLVGKATVQTYGLLLNTLLDQMLSLNDDIWYWDDVLGSYSNSTLYTVQTSPIRMWSWAQDIYHESLTRLQRLRETQAGEAIHNLQNFATGNTDKPRDGGDESPGFSWQWRQYYSIVRESISERAVTDLRRRVFSRVGAGRSEARRKQTQLRKLKELTATGLGILMTEGLSFGSSDESEDDHEWKGLLERSVALMDMILKSTHEVNMPLGDYEDKVFAGVEEDAELSQTGTAFYPQRPYTLARRIRVILRKQLWVHGRSMAIVTRQNGRPSRLTRYWLPAVTLLVSSSTILRLLVNRKQEILDWIRDFGATTRDFWFNWVVEPVRKIIGTIRHDSTSEIAIMSRDSLKADRDSLERMVVDFARDKPDIAVGSSSITDSQIAEIQSKVKEGDVTPVLRAYERDMKRPFVGAVKGDLVRSLLIQVQKTKVDLEVAISGIDALLKSQELVFGFLGLTPGILVSIGMFQYLKAIFWSRKSVRRGHRARRSVRVLRKIDKILSDATPSQNNMISYRDHGLLLSEVHVLRRLAHRSLPADVEKEFIEDVDELATLKGLHVQIRALDRIRWAYAEWLGRMN